MDIEIPGWLEPVLSAYDIPWPDIDEESFKTLPQPLRNFGEDLTAFGDAIASALQTLESDNPSHTLHALTGYFTDIRHEFLEPVKNLCDDLAGDPCTVAYWAVVSLKGALLTALTAEVANDIGDALLDGVTFGLDSVGAAAEAMAVRQVVAEMISTAEGELISAIQSNANRYLDNFVSSIVNPFISRVSSSVQGAVDSYVPQLVLQEAIDVERSVDESLGERLHLSPSQLEHIVQSITESSVHLTTAGVKLHSAIEEIFSHPAPRPGGSTLSSTLRLAAQSVVDTVGSDLVDAVGQLIDHVVSHFTTLLEDYKRAVGDLDQQATAVASREHARSGPDVLVLSAAGVGAGAAASVARTTGAVNGEAASSVQAKAVAPVNDAQTVATSPVPADPGVGTPAGAVSWATQELRSPSGAYAGPNFDCLTFCSQAYGGTIHAVGAQGTAQDEFTYYSTPPHNIMNTSPPSLQNPPPAGALVFYNEPGGQGHVGISLGNGEIVCTQDSTHSVSGVVKVPFIAGNGNSSLPIGGVSASGSPYSGSSKYVYEGWCMP
jgi:cell wall-associated NlpC family hydrolase